MLENILSAGREYFGNPPVHNSAEFPDVPVVDRFWGNVMIMRVLRCLQAVCVGNALRMELSEQGKNTWKTQTETVIML